MMKITTSQLRRIIKEEIDDIVSESPIFAAAAMAGMKGAGGKKPKMVTLKTAPGDHEVLKVDQKTGKMRVRKKGSSAAPFDIGSSDVKQVVEGNRLSEGHARITGEEFAAWKSGDWGFNSDGTDSHQLSEGMDDYDALFNQIVDALSAIQDVHGLDPQRVAMQAVEALGQRIR